MADNRLDALIAASCAPELVALIAELPEVTTWHSEPSPTDPEFLHVKASVNSEGAVYIRGREMMIALDPPEAEALSRQLGTRVEKRNPTTWRTQVTTAVAQDPNLRGRAIDSIAASILRSANRGARTRNQVSAAQRPAGPTCPVCMQELPASGLCDDHGRP